MIIGQPTQTFNISKLTFKLKDDKPKFEFKLSSNLKYSSKKKQTILISCYNVCIDGINLIEGDKILFL